MARHILAGAALAAALALSATHANAEQFSAKLSGFNEVPPALSDGKATLSLTVDRNAHTASFRLTFSGLSGAPAAAHIHFGKVHVAGGVIVFFCGGGLQPACPAATSGTVTGTMSAANIVGPAGQGIAVGDFDGLEDALDANAAYANMHTAKFPAGEIRGEVRRGDRDDDE